MALSPATRTPQLIGVIVRVQHSTRTSFSSVVRSHHFATSVRLLKSTSVPRRYSCKTPRADTHGPQKATRCAKSVQAILPSSGQFWTSAPLWRRAAINTLRCLIGCTSGDFSALWLLQTFYPEIGIGAIMGVAMVSGLTTSMLLETILLRYGRDKLSWANAAKTAVGMSFISMLTMEAAQNLVDYHLTGGAVAFDSPSFWVAAIISMGAGFITPLPYNYLRLKKYGKACH
ncbi:hypothetical protein F4859DRAFT_513039 [Xylaria cf. heliscus]|nr:hypothetical protein F4859DRAFT_513039 [Xylaria cf. heliscus]